MSRDRSLPDMVRETFLWDRHSIVIAGTHGKTTTSSMVAWILEYAGLEPGFLIGGIPQNFGISARVGASPFFVIEADEYDSAFFDKRSKFVHYRPRTLVMNNLEFDHADIFADLAAIQTQFHHLVRTVPATGLVLSPEKDENLQTVLDRGCWSEQQYLGRHWHAELINQDGSAFSVFYQQDKVGEVHWQLLGQHNVDNALMAIAAAHHAGVTLPDAIAALGEFVNVKRRMEIRGCVKNITVYDDFAHHPTAIDTTIDGLRKKVNDARIFAVLEPRSNTMKMGVHKQQLVDSWQAADEVLLFEPDNLGWSLSQLAKQSTAPCQVFRSVDAIIHQLTTQLQPGDHVLIMSNGGFGGIHQKLLDVLAGKA
mgnify:CR=1 FL=1